MVCGKEAQYSEIIATSANQIVPPKFRGRTKIPIAVLKGGLGTRLIKRQTVGILSFKTWSERVVNIALRPNLMCRACRECRPHVNCYKFRKTANSIASIGCVRK